MQLETRRAARILDFDVECRPIAWYGGDFVTKQPTAIAWKFISSDWSPVECAVIGESFDTRKVLEEEAAMLEAFRVAYDQADIVTGHYIRGFDLPLLTAALMRLRLPLLGPKSTQDTKGDLVRAHGISKAQENLGAMYELEHPKIPMNTARWADANMLLPEGIKATRKRVVGDVTQHVELRAEMLDLGHLGPTKTWSPRGRAEGYTP